MAPYDFNAPRLFVPGNLAAGARITLVDGQANYALNVLRLKAGDALLVFNGRDGEWRAELAGGNRKRPEFEVLVQTRSQTRPGDIWLLFAPLKSARLDYVVQKAVEMGAARLMPILTRRTQVARVNTERMRANVIEAAEQCGILCVPEVTEPMALDAVLRDWPDGRIALFCDEDAAFANPLAALASVPASAPTGLVIGPEGGFDPVERQQLLALPGVVRLSLGPRILRADTAAVAALALVQAAAGDWRA